MWVAAAGEGKADRGAIHLDVSERQSGHSLHRNIHFRQPLVAVAMQVDEEAHIAIGGLDRAFPHSGRIRGCEHGRGRRQQ
jgi:hypothetical protein